MRCILASKVCEVSPISLIGISLNLNQEHPNVPFTLGAFTSWHSSKGRHDGSARRCHLPTTITFQQLAFMVSILIARLISFTSNSGCYQWRLQRDQATFWHGIDETSEHQHVADAGAAPAAPVTFTNVDASEAQQFYEEIFESLQVGLDEGTSVPNLILEIKQLTVGGGCCWNRVTFGLDLHIIWLWTMCHDW